MEQSITAGRRKRISSTFFPLIMRRDKKKRWWGETRVTPPSSAPGKVHQPPYDHHTLQPKKCCLGDSMLLVKPLAAGEFALWLFSCKNLVTRWQQSFNRATSVNPKDHK
jgi:hypothetical protein